MAKFIKDSQVRESVFKNASQRMQTKYERLAIADGMCAIKASQKIVTKTLARRSRLPLSIKNTGSAKHRSNLQDKARRMDETFAKMLDGMVQAQHKNVELAQTEWFQMSSKAKYGSKKWSCEQTFVVWKVAQLA